MVDSVRDRGDIVARPDSGAQIDDALTEHAQAGIVGPHNRGDREVARGDRVAHGDAVGRGGTGRSADGIPHDSFRLDRRLAAPTCKRAVHREQSAGESSAIPKTSAAIGIGLIDAAVEIIAVADSPS